MTASIIHEFFAWAPLTVFIIILISVWAATRGQVVSSVPIGKTYACAQCGRRGNHEHMVPVTAQGAVVWYCGRCAGSH